MLQTRETAKTSAAIEVLTLATYPVNSYGSSKGALSTGLHRVLCKALQRFELLYIRSPVCSMRFSLAVDFWFYAIPQMSYCWSAWNKKQTKKQRFSSVTAFIIMISFCKAKTTGHTKFSHAESMHVVSWFRRFSLSYFAVSPFSSSGFSSVFILLCSGNKTDFYLYAQMLGRCNPMGFLYSFSCSLALSLPLPLLPPCPFFISLSIWSWGLTYFYMLPINQLELIE